MSRISIVISSLAFHTLSPSALAHDKNTLASITLAPRDASSIPTITLAPSSDYAQTVANTPTVTGSDVTLVARSQPSDGVDLYLAPDVLKNVQNALSQNCPKPDSPSCQSSIQSAVNPRGIGLQARQIPTLLLLAEAITVLSAIAIQVDGLTDSSNPHPSNHVHLNGADLAQVSSAQSASSLVFATASNDPNMVTVSQSVTAAGAPGGAAVSTATADVNGHSTGDVIITLPPDLASVLTQLVAQIDSCATSNKRSIGLDCFAAIAGGVLQNTVPGGPLAGLLVLPTMMPRITPQVIAPYLSLVISTGQKIAYFAANSDILNAVAKLVTWNLYLELIEYAFAKIPKPTEFAIPASDLTANATSSSSAACAPTGYEPCCPNCGGDAGGNKCQGDAKANNLRAGCPCIGDGPPPYQAYLNDSQGYQNAQALFGNLSDLANANFSCVNGASPPNPGSMVIPPDYCQCGANYASLYSTTTGSNPCPYTTPPGATIQLSSWTAESFDGATCTYPSTTACASYNHQAKRGTIPDPSAASHMVRRQGPGLTCIGSCPPNPAPASPAVTCSCVA